MGITAILKLIPAAFPANGKTEARVWLSTTETIGAGCLITVGGNTATIVERTGTNSCVVRFTVPAHAVGTVDIVVDNRPNGGSLATFTNAVSYISTAATALCPRSYAGTLAVVPGANIEPNTSQAAGSSEIDVSASNAGGRITYLDLALGATENGAYCGTPHLSTALHHYYLNACTMPLRDVRRLPAGTYTFKWWNRISGSNSTGNADKFALFVWRPSTASVVATIYDKTLDADGHPKGVVPGATNTGVIFSFTGAEVSSVQDGDVLIWEWHGLFSNGPTFDGAAYAYVDGNLLPSSDGQGYTSGQRGSQLILPYDLYSTDTDAIGLPSDVDTWTPVGITLSADHVIEDGTTGEHKVSATGMTPDDVSRMDLAFDVELIDSTHDWIKVVVGDQWGFVNVRTGVVGDHSSGFMLHGVT